VHLDVEQVLAAAEERRRDDPGRFLVLGDEARSARREAIRVVVRDLRQRVAGGVVEPDLAQARVVPDVLLDQNLSRPVHSHVVDHLVPFVAREDLVDRPASSGIGRVVERQSPEAALVRESRSRDEVEDMRVDGIPGAILGPLEAAHPGRHAVRLERGAALASHVTKIGERESRVESVTLVSRASTHPSM
jgi:hypothetical protein